mmetsp:Transcript_8885/g.18466  ORF Transcript_8885/g.18466 Transcript_8885/m.18466 type:complete len:87 (-) Transcript_8885:926-1186(-)
MFHQESQLFWERMFSTAAGCVGGRKRIGTLCRCLSSGGLLLDRSHDGSKCFDVYHWTVLSMASEFWVFESRVRVQELWIVHPRLMS